MGFYTCSFCADRLKPDYPRWFQYPLLLLLVRPYYCPHCGDGCFRPITSLAKLLGRPRRKTGDGSTHWTGDASTAANQLPSKSSESGGSKPKRSRSSCSERDSDPQLSREHGSSRQTAADEDRIPESEQTRSRESSSRRRRSSSRHSSRDEPESPRSTEDSHSFVRERSRQIASISGNDTPDSYERRGLVYRIYRRIRRRIRKLLGISRSSKGKRRHSSRSSSKSSRRGSSSTRRSGSSRSKRSDQSEP